MQNTDDVLFPTANRELSGDPAPSHGARECAACEPRTDIPWRLLPFLEAEGTIQMAIDAWLFEQYRQGDRAPWLRFYTWSPPALSLGYLQKKIPSRWLEPSDRVWDVVRRPTGGRAVLHQGDLTYAIATDLGARKRWEAYEAICNSLILGWQTLGVELSYGTAGRGYIHNPSCFNTATAADLVASDGSKLIGSAQRRDRQALLQHGSMVFSTDKALFEQLFEQPAPWQKSLSDRLAPDISLESVVEILTGAVANSLGIELELKPLSQAEWGEIHALSSRYWIG